MKNTIETKFYFHGVVLINKVVEQKKSNNVQTSVFTMLSESNCSPCAKEFGSSYEVLIAWATVG